MDFFSKARTNYFRVKDREAFADWVSGIGGENEIVEDDEGRVAIFFEDGLSMSYYRADTDEFLDDWDFYAEVTDHLADDSVLIVLDIGAEGTLLIGGGAVAMNNKGERREIDLTDIYELAASLGSDMTKADS